jgi:hypothetical protein
MADKWAQMQEESDDLYNEAQDLFRVHGYDHKPAQEMELKSARLQDKVNAAIGRGEY